ncbi:MAG: LptE family protein [Deltaproteobacteria bacterium]|nr:LptE family protein [Deltaproteobacteria bacterium]
MKRQWSVVSDQWSEVRGQAEGLRLKRGNDLTSHLWHLALLFTVHCSLLTVFTACGYHIAGKGGAFPGGIKTITIPFFVNQTQKPEIESFITTAIVDEFVKSGLVKVVEEEGAEATLKGVIKGYTLTPISFSRTDVIQEYRLTLQMEVVLVRGRDGKVLWEDKNITDYEDFKVTADITATKTAELDAFKKMAKDTARLIKERMLEVF